MANLVITIISIALVAIAAIAVIWYGGQVFQNTQATVYSNQIVNAFEQINSAIVLYRNTTGNSYPPGGGCGAAGGYACWLNALKNSTYLPVFPSYPTIPSAANFYPSITIDSNYVTMIYYTVASSGTNTSTDTVYQTCKQFNQIVNNSLSLDPTWGVPMCYSIPEQYPAYKSVMVEQTFCCGYGSTGVTFQKATGQ